MVIIRDKDGKVIGTQASEPYVSTRTLRRRQQQALEQAYMNPEARYERAQESRLIAQMNGAQS